MRVAHGSLAARSCRPDGAVMRIGGGRGAAATAAVLRVPRVERRLLPATTAHRRLPLQTSRPGAVTGAGPAAAAEQDQQQQGLELATAADADAAAVDASAVPSSPPAAPHVLSPPPAALQLQAALQELQDIQSNPPADDADAEAAEAAAAAAAEAAAAAAAELPPPVPTDVLLEFEQKLEADIASVFLTLTAVTGVIIYWRGVWSLLDYYLGDSVLGDVCCIIVGLTIVLWIRLSGAKVATSFWPPG